jgi:hypothetical protein
MHAADRIVRGVLAAVTAISGFCPLYVLLGRLSGRRKLA